MDFVEQRGQPLDLVHDDAAGPGDRTHLVSEEGRIGKQRLVASFVQKVDPPGLGMIATKMASPNAIERDVISGTPAEAGTIGS